MSLILDALKKSELDRQRAASPGFVAAPVPQRRGGLPLWAWIVGVLLLVNVGVLSVLLWRGQRSGDVSRRDAPPQAAAPRAVAPQAAPALRTLEAPAATASGTVARDADPAEAAPASPAPAPSDHFSPMDAPPAGAPVYAPEIPVDETPRAPAIANRGVPPLVASTPRATARRADPTLSEPAEAPDSDEVLPSVNELNLGQQGLPDIHLDVHVYATRAAERFVYINMRKYHEGATLQEGPVLEHIRRDGAVLNFRGVRFLLPRQ